MLGDTEACRRLPSHTAAVSGVQAVRDPAVSSSSLRTLLVKLEGHPASDAGCNPSLHRGDGPPVPPPTFNRALGHRHYRHSPADIATRHPQVPKPSARKRARSGTLCSAP